MLLALARREIDHGQPSRVKRSFPAGNKYPVVINKASRVLYQQIVIAPLFIFIRAAARLSADGGGWWFLSIYRIIVSAGIPRDPHGLFRLPLVGAREQPGRTASTVFPVKVVAGFFF